jgi:MFS family permease
MRGRDRKEAVSVMAGATRKGPLPLPFPAALAGRSSKRPHSTRAAVRRLATARFVSLAGTDATGVAIGFALYAQTHSAELLSLSLMLTIGAGALLAPLGGMLGDMLDRRRLMVGAELLASCVFAALAIVHTPAALLGLGLLATAIGAVFGPASGAAIAHVAGDRELAWANGIIATGSNVGKTAGRLGAGALISALGPASVFVLDALTFLVSASLIASVRRAFSGHLTEPYHEPGAAAAPAAALAPGVRGGGVGLVLREPVLRLLVASACVSTFATAFSMTAEVPLVFATGAGAAGLGALTACWGAGMVVGSWYAGRALHAANEATGVLAGRLAMAAGVGFVAVAPALGPMLVCYLVGGAGGGFMGVAAQSLVLRRVPGDLRARALGGIDACRNVAFAVGVMGAGVLVGLLGARPVYGLVGVTMALAALPVAALVRQLGGARPLRPAPAVG